MEKDIKKFKTEFQKQIEETVSRPCRSIKDDMKMPRKPELCHQYSMLFNHQGYRTNFLWSKCYRWKGFNAISNYKKSKAMARAMKELYKAQEIDHKQRLEHHTSLLAKATKTAFVHINGKLVVLDVKIGNIMTNLKQFMAETTKQFKHTWQVTVSNRLAIKFLSS